MVDLRSKVSAFCFHSNQDLFLTRRTLNNEKESYTSWIKASEWDWNYEPTDREIMTNEIVWETDEPTREKNLELTNSLSQVLNDNKISRWIYFTGNKSYHIHFILNGLEKIDDGDYRKKIKLKISEDLIKDKELFDYIDKNNFNKKKMIRLEGALNPKKNIRTELFFKASFDNQEEISNKLIKDAMKKITHEEISVVKKEYNELVNTLDQPKVYCMLMQKALTEKFPEGNRHMNLCPNAVAILSKSELKQLAKVQGMELSEFEGWAKKKPQFNCVQFRRYGAEVGHKKICMECMKNSFHKNNW